MKFDPARFAFIRGGNEQQGETPASSLTDRLKEATESSKHATVSSDQVRMALATKARMEAANAARKPEKVQNPFPGKTQQPEPPKPPLDEQIAELAAQKETEEMERMAASYGVIQPDAVEPKIPKATPAQRSAFMARVTKQSGVQS